MELDYGLKVLIGIAFFIAVIAMVALSIDDV